MRLWRICREPYATDPMSGRGGLVVSGRWNTKGRRVVYTSETLSLAALEYLVHVDKGMVPPDLVTLEIDVPDTIKRTSTKIASLPKSWRTHPAPVALRRFGDDWLEKAATAVLRVPSALIPEEFNLLLNPEHPDSRSFKVVARGAFEYDPRLRP